MIKAVIVLSVACLVFSCAEIKKVQQRQPITTAIPVLNIQGDSTTTALHMSMLDIKTVVAANIATTTFEINFYNPNDRVLEGEFEFPLADGQNITRYALEVNGSLREGVVVEKAKARVAFENTVRRAIDPGLVEKTKGNNFRTRIYPIPAKGYKRVLVAIEQTLEQGGNDLFYQLPLYAEESIDTFSINIAVIKVSEKPQLDEAGIAKLEFNKQKDTYVAEYHENNFVADKTIALTIPGNGGNQDIILTENHINDTYFYVNSKLAPQHKDKKKPATIGLLWDISSSGEKRNLEKEMDLLKKYLAGLGNTTVSLLPFNIYLQGKEDFSISGDPDKLIQRIKSLTYDGGTQLGSIDLSKYSFDEVLLFSDGLSTFGKEEMILPNAPVMAITTSPSVNYSYLKYITQQTRGDFIDLGKLETASALKNLQGQSLQIVNVVYNQSEIDELITQTTPIANTGLSFAGKLKTPTADIKVELGFGKEVVLTKEYKLTKNETNEYDQVKRIWATMKINQLDLEYDKNKEAITKLGKEYSIVTQNTSLLVLDRVEDYVEYEIVPPAELQKEYFALLKQKQDSRREEKEEKLQQALVNMETLKEWWNTKYPIRVKEPAIVLDSSGNINITTPPDTTVLSRISDSGYLDPASGLEVTQGVGAFSRLDSVRVTYYGTSSSAVSLPGEAIELNSLNLADGDADGVYDSLDVARKPNAVIEPTIQLNEWKPDATYLKTMETTPVKDRVVKYRELKKEFSNQPSFFVDMARFFIQKNERQLGILVLSNIAEMKLEDATLLRIVANELLDASEKELAILIFTQIMEIREEDPQSYRDLALAYNETREYNKAVELLYKVATDTWDFRFHDVAAIALNEMNAIISAHPGSVNTSYIDRRLIYPMPVDVRIVICWNTDNSDVDLWVTDPHEEKCYYAQQETRIGGRITQDVTQGYGPEEFLLKKASKGNYTIDANLYGDHRQTLGGPISVKAELFTDFGKPTQKRKIINLRVTNNSEVVNLGSLRFGS